MNMRKFSFLAVLIPLLLAGGCQVDPIGLFVIDPDVIVDWAPVNVYLTVQDKSGKDLLDPESQDNWIEGTTITFKGETYKGSREWRDARNDSDNVATRAYLAVMRGLNLVKDSGNGFKLVFGEIDGAVDMDEDLVVSWPDGTKDTIHYHCSNHRWGRNPDCDRSWKLNGKKASSNIFKFVK